MSRLLDTALVRLNDEVQDLKSQLKSESERGRRLEQQVNQLKHVGSSLHAQHNYDPIDPAVSEYARLNGALTSALGLGRPWVRTFFSFRKILNFTSYNTPITYKVQVRII